MPAWIVGATTRIVPVTTAPSAVEIETGSPGLSSESRASGASPRHSMRPLRRRRSISEPACAIWPTVTVRAVITPSSGAVTFVNLRRSCDVSTSAFADSTPARDTSAADLSLS